MEQTKDWTPAIEEAQRLVHEREILAYEDINKMNQEIRLFQDRMRHFTGCARGQIIGNAGLMATLSELKGQMGHEHPQAEEVERLREAIDGLEQILFQIIFRAKDISKTLDS